MKKLLYLLIAATLTSLLACGGDDEPVVKRAIGKLDPDAMISINPATGVQIRSTDSLPTALEVVKRAKTIRFYTAFEDSHPRSEYYTGRGFNEGQKDTITPRLLMFGTDVIAQFGWLIKDFIYGRDVIIMSIEMDTLAYVPNSVLKEARVKIEAAYNDSNFVEVYRLFDEAFTFIPITGEKYKALKEAGKN